MNSIEVAEIFKTEQAGFAGLIERRRAEFVGRKAILTRYQKMILEPGTSIVMLSGKEGCGKTSVMAELTHNLSDAGCQVMPFFCGYDFGSRNTRSMLMQMVYQMETLLDTDHVVDQQQADSLLFHGEDLGDKDLWERFSSLMRDYEKVGRKQLIFAIDGLDKLERDDLAMSFGFLPSYIADNVRFVLSCGDDLEVPENLKEVKGFQEAKVTFLEDGDMEQMIIQVSEKSGRKLEPSLIQELKQKKGIRNPLYLQVCLQRLLNAADETEVQAFLEAMERYDGQAEDVYAQMCQKGLHGLPVESLAVLAVSRYGMTVEELETICRKAGVEYNSQGFEQLQKELGDLLMTRADGRIDFVHSALREGVLRQVEDSAAIHQLIVSSLMQRELTDPVSLQELPWHLQQSDAAAEMVDWTIRVKQNANVSERDQVAQAFRNVCQKDQGAFLSRCLQEQAEDMDSFTAFVVQDLLPSFSLSQSNVETLQEIYIHLISTCNTLLKERNTADNVRNLAISYGRLGDWHVSQGSPEKAAPCYQQYLACASALYEGEQTAQDQRLYAIASGRFGDALYAMGNPEPALEQYKHLLEIAGNLPEGKDSRTRLGDLAAIYYRMGDICGDLDEDEEKLQYYREEIKVRQILQERWPDNGKLQELGEAWLRLGEAASTEELWEEVCICYDQYQDIFTRLYNEGGNAEMLRNLAAAVVYLGDVYFRLGKMRSALKQQMQGFKLRRKLYDLEEDMGDMKTIAQSLRRIGYVFQAVRKMEEAGQYYFQSLHIFVQLYTSKKNAFSLQEAQEAVQIVEQWISRLDVGAQAGPREQLQAIIREHELDKEADPLEEI